MPSVAAALWVQSEQERVAKLGGAESPLVLAERAWDAGRQQGRGEGRAQAGSNIDELLDAARRHERFAAVPTLATVVAALRGALAGGDTELRAAVEGALSDLQNPTRPERRTTDAPGLSQST